ncbi:MAG TPA: hypothetical protein VM143_12155 [Acidimicrobiales bacterium]|nr:hypothetical protein [Acidimicrobiales bacterium]
MTITNASPPLEGERREGIAAQEDLDGSRRAGVPRSWLLLGGSASLSAGAVHVAAVAAHSEHRQAVWAFLTVALLQLIWGALAATRPSRAAALAGAVISGAALVGWAVAKTTGIGLVEGLDAKEPVRLADLIAAGFAAASLASCAAFVLSRGRTIPRPLSIAAAVAILGAGVPATAAAVDHPHGAGHGAGELASAVPPKTFDPTLPIDLGGVPGVTLQQQARAENLLSLTISRLPKFSDPSYAEANGFRSIRDGVTGVEHYLNRAYMEDDVELDPDQPESLVYDTKVTPKKLVAAMYMATPGTTLDAVPDIGGALTQWHIHNNLCFTAEGRVAGLTQGDGTCRAPLVKGTETPMIHVWIVPHPCGPFAALEGVGGGQIRPGDTVACDQVHGT